MFRRFFSRTNHFRKRILKEGGFSHIEQYMYEQHPMLRRASTECMCNLVVQEEVSDVQKNFEQRIRNEFSDRSILCRRK